MDNAVRHLHLVPAPEPTECRCERTAGRYWAKGTWNCTATDHPVRWSAHKGWHHYTGHRTTIQLTEQVAA
jgi:hypothetical protein